MFAPVITEECMLCCSCEVACPVGAIHESDDIMIIDPAKCVQCEGHADSPTCISVCSNMAITWAGRG
ncbi:4Fe-4S binding protein [Chloroflexota bacterium]